MIRVIDLEETICEVRGDDARSWLDGQLTCDVKQLPEGGSLRGLRLGKNGRILAHVRILDAERGLDLAIPRAGAEELLAELDRYVIMEDVELALRADLHVFAALDPASADLPEGVECEVFGRPARLVRLGASEDASAAFGARPLPAEEADALRVAAGEPGRPELSRGLLPQEAGLDSVVSFSKGCYLGQEPVVMLEHRGRPPKRLARLRLSLPVPPGAALTLPSGEGAGEVTSAATVEGEHFALALIKRRAEAEETLLVADTPALERSWVRDLRRGE